MVREHLKPTPAQADDVDDITQAALTGLLVALSSLEIRTVPALHAFLDTIVRRTVCNHLRERYGGDAHPRRSLDESVSSLSTVIPLWQLLTSGQPSPRTMLESVEDGRRLKEAYGKLDATDQELLYLYLYDHLTSAQVAERLRLSARAARARLLITLGTLRREVTRPEGNAA